MWILLIAAVLVIFFYTTVLLRYSYWSKRGCAGSAMANLWKHRFDGFEPTFVYRNIAEPLQQCSRKKLLRHVHFLKPTLILRCPKLIKLITLQEFDTFPEHEIFQSPEENPLFSNNLLTMRGGQRWRNYRSIIGSCLTRSKLKLMFMSMQQCAVQCITHICNQEGRIVLEMADVFNKYANDIIFTSVFGTTSNTFKNPQNKFYLMGKTATKIAPWRSLMPFLNSINPILVEIFKPSLKLARVSNFFQKQVIHNVQQHQICDDNNFCILSQLIETRNTNCKFVLTDEDVTSQAIVAYLGGLNTATAAMCFTSYELALNPSVQKKLQMEVDSTPTLTYDSLLEMKYLNMVISESLRKWPPITFTDRRSVKPFTLESIIPGEKSVQLEAGTVIYIPIYSLHRDPAYYPDPEKFDPERFSDDVRDNINQLYLPFGLGPRTCFASRLALLEIKLILYYIVRDFDIIPTEKTPTTIRYDPGQYFAVPKTKFWIELIPRTNTFST